MLSRIVKYILKPITTLLVVVTVVFAILVVGVRLLGVEIYVVLSPSMEPVYPTGTLLYVKEADPDELQVGDIITFRLYDITATHRIIEVLEEEPLKFRTQGDANDIADTEPVPAANIIGKPVFSLPYLGYAASYIQKPPGSYAAIAISAAIVFLVLIVDLLDNLAKAKEAKANTTQPKGD